MQEKQHSCVNETVNYKAEDLSNLVITYQLGSETDAMSTLSVAVHVPWLGPRRVPGPFWRREFHALPRGRIPQAPFASKLQ